MTSIHTLAMADPQRGQMPEKPQCCASAARGHCTGHCPRIEDVLYSQRKGKTNKGAQRWRCKACGTKWTSKGIIPPVVPDTIVNSIGYGSGPEEISIDLSNRARPYKKSRMTEGGIISTSPSPFPSLFNSNSPNGSPISSPPSPTSMLSTVPGSGSSRSLMPSNNANSYVPILPTQQSSHQQSQQINLRSSQGSTSMSANGLASLNSTKPIVVGPSQSGGNPSTSNRPLSYSSSQVQQMQSQSMTGSRQSGNLNNNSISRIPSKSSPTGTSSPMYPSNSSKLPFLQSTPYQPQATSSSLSSTQSSLRLSPTNPVPKVPSIYQSSMREMSQSPTPFGGNLSNGSESPTSTPLMFQEPSGWSVVPQFSTQNSSHKNNIPNTSYVPSSNLVDCLKRVIHSVSVFSREFSVDNRLKLVNYLSILSSPSSDSMFNTNASKKIQSSLDIPLFQIAKSYQSLYQRISHHHSAMEDRYQPVGEIYFDENEIVNFLAFYEAYQPVEELFETSIHDIQQYRDSLNNKKDSLEASLSEPNLLSNLYSSSNGNGVPLSLEQTRSETIKLLDSLAPLETTLTNIESRLRSIHKELSLVMKVHSILELLYSIHIQSWRSIIEKHQRLLLSYIADYLQQSCLNNEKMAFTYSLLKHSGRRAIETSENDHFLDELSTNSHANKLAELLNKYELSKQSSCPTPVPQPKERKILAVYHSQCLEHTVPEDHPESPKRLTAVIRAINEFAKQSDRIIVKNDPEEILDKWILTVHSPDYLRQLDEFTEKLETNEIRPLNVNDGATQAGGGIQFAPASDGEDGDTFISKNSLRAARRAAGATLCAVDQVVRGHVSSAFVAARPPGHHAGREGLTSGTSSQGFCLLNNVAIAAKYAQLKYGVEKIAIVDFDVHHGNGTEEILAGDPGFLFLSIHMFEEGFYPGSGGGNSHGVILPNGAAPPEPVGEQDPNMGPPANNIVNIPMDPKSSAVSFIKAFSIIIEKLNEYQPELLLISCGFDAHINDHLASLCLLEENYIEITKQLRQVADRWCKGRLISVLEGGYNITALKQCTTAHLMALADDD